MIDQLTSGTVKAIMSREEINNPVVQVVVSKRIPVEDANRQYERYRLLISDGVHLYKFAMLLTPLHTSEQLPDNSIIKILNHVFFTVKVPEEVDLNLMVILKVEILQPGSKVGVVIGNPTLLDARLRLTNGSSAPAPGTSGPAPSTSAPSSVTSGPAPGTSAPSPVTSGPAPVTSGPAPVTSGPAPGTSAPAPGTSAPAPGTSAPAPGTSAFAPDTAAFTTDTSAPAPITFTPIPGPSQPSEPNHKSMALCKPVSVFSEQSKNDIAFSPLINSNRIHPIVSLKPYQRNWTIKAVVINKSNVRNYCNNNGEGKIFSVDFVDESGEIRAKAFNEQVDKFYDLLEVNKVFYISECRVKLANKLYSTLNNDYELIFENRSTIIPCQDGDVIKIPLLRFNFEPLSSIQKAAPGQMLDCIGIAKSCGDVVNRTSKNKTELKKRDITIVDQSFTAVTLTLWNTDAEDFNGEMRPVVAVKGAKVAEFMGGKTLSLVVGSTIQINPDIPEAHKLRIWFDQLDENAKFTFISFT